MNKMKKITNYDLINKYKLYLDVIMNIHNNIRKDKYLIIAQNCKIVFNDLNRMIFTLII